MNGQTFAIVNCRVDFTTEKVLRISSKTGKEGMKPANKNHKAILLMLWGGGVQEECFISDSHKAIYRTLDGTCWRSIRVLQDIFCSEGISSTSNAGCL